MSYLREFYFIHQYAVRDIKRNFKSLWIIFITLFISLFLLSSIFTIKKSLNYEIETNSKELLGGDLEISSGIHPLSEEIIEKISESGQLSQTVKFHTMVSREDKGSIFTDIRAIDKYYPLYGSIQTNPKGSSQTLFLGSSNPSILINENIQNQFELEVGDNITILNKKFTVQGIILSVPNLDGAMIYGEFALISKSEFEKFNLTSAGSFLDYDYRLKIKNNENTQPQIEKIKSFINDDKTIKIRTPRDGSQNLRRAINNFFHFLSLVSVSAMFIAGIGISNTFLSFINKKILSIAIQKSLGFFSRTIQLIYFYEILLILFITSILSYLLGLLSPIIANIFIPASLNIDLQFTLSFLDYFNLFFIGLLVVLIFSIPTLYSINLIKATSLFRNVFQQINLFFSFNNILFLIILSVLFIVYFIFQTDEKIYTFFYFISFFASILVFFIVSFFLIFIFRHFFNYPSNSFKIAKRNIAAKKSLAPIITISLGIGFTLLLMLSFVASNLKREIAESIPDIAPDIFFVSVNKDDKERLALFITTLDQNAIVEFQPVISASFVSLNSVPIDTIIQPNNNSAWAIEGDRRISWYDNPQTANSITKGEWWTKNDSEELFISIDSKIASDFRIKINDQITLNILGREIVGTVKNFRKVDYRDLSINFAIIINDSFADKLPYEYIGTLSSNLSINEIQSKILKQFPNISVIKIGNILSKVSIILNKILIAVTSISLVIVAIGLIVIISAILVQTNLRTYQNLIYKILGINFSTLVKAACLEFLFIYLSIIFFAITIAALGSYYIVENIFRLEWIFDLNLTLTLTMVTGIITFILILITNKNTFNPPVYPLIRNE